MHERKLSNFTWYFSSRGPDLWFLALDPLGNWLNALRLGGLDELFWQLDELDLGFPAFLETEGTRRVTRRTQQVGSEFCPFLWARNKLDELACALDELGQHGLLTLIIDLTLVMVDQVWLWGHFGYFEVLIVGMSNGPNPDRTGPKTENPKTENHELPYPKTGPFLGVAGPGLVWSGSGY